MNKQNAKLIIGLKDKDLEFTGTGTEEMFEAITSSMSKGAKTCVLQNKSNKVLLVLSEITNVQWGVPEGGE